MISYAQSMTNVSKNISNIFPKFILWFDSVNRVWFSDLGIWTPFCLTLQWYFKSYVKISGRNYAWAMTISVNIKYPYIELCKFRWGHLYYHPYKQCPWRCSVLKRSVLPISFSLVPFSFLSFHYAVDITTVPKLMIIIAIFILVFSLIDHKW